MCTNVIPHEYRLLDSSVDQSPILDKFNPDGYYFSKDSFSLKNYAFGWLSIFTRHDGSNPVLIRLVRPNGIWEEVKPYKYKIGREASFFYFKHKVVGEIAIEGSFTGKKGPEEDAVVSKETIVFKGRFVVNGKSTPIEMTWWEGD